MYEVLKSIQSTLDGLDRGIGEVKQELISIRGHMPPIQNDIHNVRLKLDRHDNRLGRIERRLELRELTDPRTPYHPHP